MKKYELTTETKVVYGHTLYRIRALVAFGNVDTGELGGWIEKESNLAQDGNAWVYGDAEVYDNAWVYGDAEVYGNARVSGDAEVYGHARIYGDTKVSNHARIFGNARIYDNAEVYGYARVYGNAWVSGDAWVYGNAWVYDNAEVYGYARVYGNAWVSGDAWVYGNASIMTISHIGSRFGTTTFFALKNGKIGVQCGCFYGDIDQFAARVEQTHGDNQHGKAYKLAIELAKLRLQTRKE